MKAVPKEETIRFRVAAEQANLESLLAKRDAMEKKLQSTAAEGGETDGIIQRLGQYNTRIESTRGRIEGLAADFDRLGQDGEQDVSKLTRGLTGLGGGLTKARTGAVSFVSSLVDHIPLVGSLFSNVTEKVGELATSLLPEAATGIGSVVSGFMGLLAVAPVLAVVVIAMAALVVSIGEALIGIVALGAAFLVALAPIAIVLGLVLVKIKDIVSSQQQMASATANLKSAIDAQRSAVTQLHQAETTESTTRLAAIQAERQALLALQDAENGVADARLGVSSAKLQLQQAKLTLAEFKQSLAGMGTSPGDLLGKSSTVDVGGNVGQTQQGSSPLAWLAMILQYRQDLLDVKTAAQGTKDAVQQVKDATNTQLTAQENWAQYLKRGLKGYQPYLQAIDSVRTAQENLIRADDQLKSAELAKSQVIKHGASDASAFLKMWGKLKHTLGVVFGPAEQAVFGGIEKALGILAGKLKPLMPAFLTLGKAIGGAFVWWAKMMTKPDNMKLLVGIIKDAAKWTTVMSHYLGAALKFVLQIAEDAMPSLIGIFTHWGKQLSGANTHVQGIHAFIEKCIDKATTFWHVLQHIGVALVTIAGAFKTIEGIVHTIIAPFKAAFNVGHSIGNFVNSGSSGSPAQATMQQVRQALNPYIKLPAPKIALPAGLTPEGTGNVTNLTQNFHHPIGDTDHFARKMKKNLSGLGGGVKG